MDNFVTDSLLDDIKKRPLSLISTSSSGSCNSTHILIKPSKKKSGSSRSDSMGNFSSCASSGSNLNHRQDGQRIDPKSYSELNISDNSNLANNIYATSPKSVSCQQQFEVVTKFGILHQDNVNEFDDVSNGSDDNYVQRIIQEVQVTEDLYVKELACIIEGYMKPLMTCGKDQIPCHQQEIFGNLKELYRFHNKLLDRLKTCNSVADVSGVFIEHSENFSLYSFYCMNYPKSVEAVNCILKIPDIAEYLKVLQKKLNHKLPLASYLLKPVQRISKYHLFLQNILRHCTKDDEEIAEKAFHSMVKILTEINQSGTPSHLVDRSMKGNQLTDFEELLLKDKLVLVNEGRAESLLHIFVFPKALLIAQKKNKSKFLVKLLFKESEAVVMDDVSGCDPRVFFLVPLNNPGLAFKFKATNVEQKIRWCRQLKRVLSCDVNSLLHNRSLFQEIQEVLMNYYKESFQNQETRMLNAEEAAQESKSSKSQNALSNKYMTIEKNYLSENVLSLERNAYQCCNHSVEANTTNNDVQLLSSEKISLQRKQRSSFDCGAEVCVTTPNQNISSKDRFSKMKSCSDSTSKPSGCRRLSQKVIGARNSCPEDRNYLFTLKVPKSKSSLKNRLMFGYKEARCKDVVLEGTSGVYKKLSEHSDHVDFSLHKAFVDDRDSSILSPCKDDVSDLSFSESLDFYYEDRLLQDLEDVLCDKTSKFCDDDDDDDDDKTSFLINREVTVDITQG